MMVLMNCVVIKFDGDIINLFDYVMDDEEKGMVVV